MNRLRHVGLLNGPISWMLTLCMLAAGCATTHIDKVRYHQFADAFELSNNDINLIIVPQIGRAVWYGYNGERNIIFDNSTVANQTPPGSFINWGGDKAWIWPQTSWIGLTGHDWPPPPAMDGQPWRAEIVSPKALRLTSPLIQPWGVRIVREVMISEKGTRVIWHNRLVRESGMHSEDSSSIAAWSITQVPVPSALRVRLVDASASTSGFKMLMDDPWASISKVADWLTIVRDPASTAKVGIDGDQIEATLGEVMFLQTMPNADGVSGFPSGYKPMERAQIYSQPDPAGNHVNQPAYLELEFTSPSAPVANPGQAKMDVIWELRKLPKSN